MGAANTRPRDAACSVCKSKNSDVSKGIRGGYTCTCKDGYHGNPYIPGGCQGSLYIVIVFISYKSIVSKLHAKYSMCWLVTCVDIDECYQPEPLLRPKRCYGDCTNTVGSFECHCPPAREPWQS